MNKAATRYKMFCAISPGLEDLLEAELQALDLWERVRRVPGGCEVRCDPAGVWDLVLRTRLAESVRARVGNFKARNFDELRAGLARLPWSAWLPRNGRPEVRATCRKSKLWHSGAVQQRAQQQIHDRLADPSSSAAPPSARVYVRIDRDNVRVSVDASGERLHRRGERKAVGKAPMRETLAAAMLRAAGLPGDSTPLWDPFCGAGTLLLEAGRIAAGGLNPRADGYAFELWPTHDEHLYSAWTEDNLGLRAPTPPLFGSDIDPKEISAAERNLSSAALTATLSCGDFEAVAPTIPLGADVVSNLPYGRRAPIGGMLRRLGRLLNRREDLSCWLLLGHEDHAKVISSRLEHKLTFRNGGLRVHLFHLPRRG